MLRASFINCMLKFNFLLVITGPKGALYDDNLRCQGDLKKTFCYANSRATATMALRWVASKEEGMGG